MLYNKQLNKHRKGSTSYGNLERLHSTLLSAFTEGQLMRLIKTTRTSLLPCTQHQWHQWSEMSAQSLKDSEGQHPPSHSLFTLLQSDNRRTATLQRGFIPQTPQFITNAPNSFYKSVLIETDNKFTLYVLDSWLWCLPQSNSARVKRTETLHPTCPNCVH